ncbi:MAG TPA: peptidase S10, partial [Sphingomicrobium sp.]|nr:peptidase S10 [Sphingomicrobium sp.]
MIPVLAAFLATQAAPVTAQPAQPPKAEAQKSPKKDETREPAQPLFTPTEVKSTGSVTVGGKRIAYQAVAGTLVVHSKGWEDTDALEATAKKGDDEDDDKPRAESSMFYTAYFKNGVSAANRPIIFLFNGGPGSSTVWLHMGAFGPVRVETADAVHTPPAPYGVVNNDQSLLDVADLVFIDAPGTGFSR